jgi:hypothetical protein
MARPEYHARRAEWIASLTEGNRIDDGDFRSQGLKPEFFLRLVRHD